MVNGERRQVPDDTTAAALLAQLGIQPERVVVEVNLTILKRDQLVSTVLHPGDQVEIVHFVGGGSITESQNEGSAHSSMIPRKHRGTAKDVSLCFCGFLCFCGVKKWRRTS